MNFEQEAPDCTWIIDKLMKMIWNFKFGGFLLDFKNLIRIYLDFDFGLLRIGFINGCDSQLRP
jgi:hypothetical protein